jgi:hypothetical protein
MGRNNPRAALVYIGEELRRALSDEDGSQGGKMLKVCQRDVLLDASEFVRAWALPDGTRCVLAVVGPFLELRIIRHDTILRHDRFTGIARALEVAQIWRLEADMNDALHQAGTRVLCPECCEEAFAEDIEDGHYWFRCSSCDCLWQSNRVADQQAN